MKQEDLIYLKAIEDCITALSDLGSPNYNKAVKDTLVEVKNKYIQEEMNLEKTIEQALEEFANYYINKKISNPYFKEWNCNKEAKRMLRLLPSWSKCSSCTSHAPEVVGIMTDWIIKYNGFSISMNDLERLPKEE